MARLLSEAAAHRIMPDYVGKLLAAFEAKRPPVPAARSLGAEKGKDQPSLPSAQPLIERLSQREPEVLRLLARGLSNHTPRFAVSFWITR